MKEATAFFPSIPPLLCDVVKNLRKSWRHHRLLLSGYERIFALRRSRGRNELAVSFSENPWDFFPPLEYFGGNDEGSFIVRCNKRRRPFSTTYSHKHPFPSFHYLLFPSYERCTSQGSFSPFRSRYTIYRKNKGSNKRESGRERGHQLWRSRWSNLPFPMIVASFLYRPSPPLLFLSSRGRGRILLRDRRKFLFPHIGS